MSIPLLSKLKALQPIWHSLTPRRRRQLLGLQILSLAAAAGEVANLGVLLPFLRLLANPLEGLKALGPIAAPLQNLPQEYLLFSLGLGFLLIVVVSTALRVVTIRVRLKLGMLIASDLGEKVLAAVLFKPFPWHLRHNSSIVLGYLTKDVEQVHDSIQSLLLLVVNSVVVVLLGGSLIALAPVAMSVITLLMLGFYLLIFKFTKRTLRSDGQRLRTNYQSSLQVAQEALGGIRDVLLDRSQPFFLDEYHSRSIAYRLAGASINIKAQAPRYLIEGFSIVLIVSFSLILALSGQGINQQLPLLGALALGSFKILYPLQQCFGAFSSLKANQTSLEKLKPFLTANLEKKPETDFTQATLISRPSKVPLIFLQHVSFKYDDVGSLILHDVSLVINSGERIAFVGSTGSGKSTTSDIILGLLSPTEGKVLINGSDLNATPGLVETWQHIIAHVPQQIYLSDASFAANIAFGVPESQIDHGLVRLAANQSRIAELIESSPDGYATLVGERGVRLSGGQRQRIGIARALYKQAKVIILDEATSALDNRTEAEVMAAIESLDRQITVILIAHRLSTVRRCDRIVMLEKGRIIGLGSYDDLVAGNVAFQALARQRDQISS